jgi:ABC-2 type transport system permease protein
MFSGQFVPLKLMPTIVQTVSEYLPFQMMIYFPIQMILGRLTQPEIIRGYIVGGIWLVISILFFNFIWKSGLKQYSAVGA